MFDIEGGANFIDVARYPLGDDDTKPHVPQSFQQVLGGLEGISKSFRPETEPYQGPLPSPYRGPITLQNLGGLQLMALMHMIAGGQ